jgi:hypothetical protein
MIESRKDKQKKQEFKQWEPIYVSIRTKWSKVPGDIIALMVAELDEARKAFPIVNRYVQLLCDQRACGWYTYKGQFLNKDGLSWFLWDARCAAYMKLELRELQHKYEAARTEIAIDTDIHYTCTDTNGHKITLSIVSDCGLVNNERGGTWRKVICRPIGLNNCPPLTLDFTRLYAVR